MLSKGYFTGKIMFLSKNILVTSKNKKMIVVNMPQKKLVSVRILLRKLQER